MKIVSLQSNNVLRLDAVEINPKGNAIIIGGENGQGKTSVLDSILLALGGRKAKHQKPLKDGSKKGKIVVDLDEITVTRTFTNTGGGTLVVENKEGTKFSSPQSMLDKLTGELTFDPLAWSNMDDEKQLNTLKSMVGLDFTNLDNKRVTLYNERTQVNTEGKSLKSQFDSMPNFEDVEFKDLPKEEIKVEDLLKELKDAEDHNEVISQLKKSIEDSQILINNSETEIRVCDNAINDAKSIIKNNETKKVEFEKGISNLTTSMNSYSGELKMMKPAEIDPIKEKMSSAEGINTNIKKKDEKTKLSKTLQAKRKESTDLSDKIEAIDDEKSKKLSETKFPVDDLSFDETGVLFRGIPSSQASSADRLNISVGMGIAMNPKLRVLLIRDGSLLDENNLKMISEKAEKADMQIWIERVGKGEECQIIIEDGKVLQTSK